MAASQPQNRQWLVHLKWPLVALALSVGMAISVASVAYSGCADSRDARVRSGFLVCRDRFAAAWEAGIVGNAEGSDRRLQEFVLQRDECEVGVMAAAVRTPGSATATTITPLPPPGMGAPHASVAPSATTALPAAPATAPDGGTGPRDR